MPGRPPSLRAIAAFEAAARHQSFTRAAQELNLTHGAISHAIRGLEERLGDRLFERRARGVVLTETGRILAGTVRLSVEMLSEAFEPRPWLQRSHLRISLLAPFAARILVPRLAAFRAAHPDITLELRMTDTLADIGAGKTDIGVRYGPGRWAGLNAFRVADEELFPVVSPHWSRPLPQSPAEMRDEELIRHPDFPWKLWFAAAGVHRPEPNAPLTIDDSALLLEAAADGHGIALARSRLVEADLRSGRLVRLFETAMAAPYAYWMVWDPVSEKLEAIGRFRDWLAGLMGNAGQSGEDRDPG